MEENKEELKKEDKSLAMELLEELKRQNKRLIAALFVVISLWAATIGGFIWYLNQYDFVNYTQDGEGYNNINTGEQGDVINGAEIPSKEEKSQQ